MRGRVVVILVLAVLVVAAGGTFYFLRAERPEPVTIQVGGKTVVLKPGENISREVYELVTTNRELIANSDWVLIEGQWEPMTKGVPLRLDVPQVELPEGHRECPIETVWVVVQGEEGPIEVPVPLDIPANWTGRYQGRAEGNVGYWDYVGDAGSKQPIFAIAVMTEAQWEAIRGKPHGEALLSYGGLVWAYSPALDNPFSGSQGDEFQRMVGEAYQIAESLGTFFLPADPAQAARQVLLAYFDALRAGRYAEAARLYAGSYEVLVDMNPGIDPQSHAALLDAACTVNGFMCQLKPASLVQVGPVGEEIEYAVEFQNADGSPFKLECPPDVPECATRTQWTYTVRTLDSQYFVLELPVYVP